MPFPKKIPMLTERDLELKSVQYRKALLRLIKNSGAGHTGGDLSCLDILNVLYNRILRVSPETFHSPDRDYYIQSKGHCAEALFVVLADRGFFPEKDLETLNRYGSHYIGHPTRDVNGGEQNTGALGHGPGGCRWHCAGRQNRSPGLPRLYFVGRWGIGRRLQLGGGHDRSALSIG